MLAKVKTVVPSNSQGVCTAAFYGNDVIQPAGTFYRVTFTDGSGTCFVSNTYKFTGSGTFDISSLTPFVP